MYLGLEVLDIKAFLMHWFLTGLAPRSAGPRSSGISAMLRQAWINGINTKLRSPIHNFLNVPHAFVKTLSVSTLPRFAELEWEQNTKKGINSPLRSRQ